MRDLVTEGLLNPLQELLAESPWYVAALGILALACVFGGTKALVPTAICLAGILFLDLWHDAMVTLDDDAGRHRDGDGAGAGVRRLDGSQPPGRLPAATGARRRPDHPAVRLPDPGARAVRRHPVHRDRGGVVYAAPVAIKLVADGVKGVSPTTVEASRSTGATTWQEITKVQLPMARGSIVLAANQGLLYVLAMVVIGGLVGAGALGYDVVLGFSRSEEWGRGAAAGLTIVLLGIMIDRITRAAADFQSGAPERQPA